MSSTILSLLFGGATFLFGGYSLNKKHRPWSTLCYAVFVVCIVAAVTLWVYRSASTDAAGVIVNQRTNAPNSANVLGNNNRVTINPRAQNRALDALQQANLGAFLETLPDGLMITVKTLDGDREAWAYADNFQSVIREKSRAANDHIELGMFWRPTPIGLHVVSQTETDSAAPYRNALAEQLTRSGVSVEVNHGDWVPTNRLYIVVGVNPDK